MNMHSRLIFVVALVIGCAPSAYAQRFVETEVSVGGQFAVSPESHVAGWYIDAMKSFAPALSIVAAVSGDYSVVNGPAGHEQWTGMLGGIRRRWVTTPGANVFAQFLIGGWRWSQSFDEACAPVRRCRFSNGFWMTGIQPGVGIELPVDSRWSVRAHADLRVGAGDDAGTAAWMGGGGVTRFWGRR